MDHLTFPHRSCYGRLALVSEKGIGCRRWTRLKVPSTAAWRVLQGVTRERGGEERI